MTTTGPMFRAWRLEQKLGLNATAKELKVSAQFLSDFERGHRTMGPENVKKLELFMVAHQIKVAAS